MNLFVLLFTVAILSSFVVIPAAAQANDSKVTYVSGTCKSVPPSFNMQTFYNQNQSLVTDFTGIDVSSSNWDLGKDGAFVGYNVFLCLPAPGTTGYPGYTPPGLTSLIEQKGFTVTQSCNMAGLLSYPRYHVFMIVDRIEYQTISDADAQAVANFYVLGGGMLLLTDNCPYINNVNAILAKMPSMIAKMQMQNNNGITPFPLTYGNPQAMNKFGRHVIFTGVPEMSSGHSLSIPYYDKTMAKLGVFASLCTVQIDGFVNRPIPCSGEAPTSYLQSHSSVMYLDPPLQLWNVTESCNWGRIVIDTAWTRYGVAPTRTGSWRLAANAIVWLLNLERIIERNASGTGSYALLNCSRSNDTSTNVTGQSQVLGCSNGDSITLQSPNLMCHVGFASSSGSAPSCLALVVTETEGTTCILNTANAAIGTYWIIVNGQNTSLQFSVTSSSLIPRGTLVTVTGTCNKISSTSVSGCTDGSSLTIDWTLPQPRKLTLGLGSSTSICSSFQYSGTYVYCILSGINKLPRGQYQMYIDGVATGIPMIINSDVMPLNHKLCSLTHTVEQTPTTRQSPSRTLFYTPTLTEKDSKTVTDTATVSSTHTITTTSTTTATQSISQASSGSVTETAVESVTSSLHITASPEGNVTTTHEVILTKTMPLSHSRTASNSSDPSQTMNTTMSEVLTWSHAAKSISKSVAVTRSTTWGCVDGAALARLLSPWVSGATTVSSVQDSAIRNGTMITLALPSLSGVTDPALHVPWFQAWSTNVTVVAVAVPNQMGFGQHLGTRTGITVSLPLGLRATSDGTISAVLEIPSFVDYRIYEAETVTISIPLSAATLGQVCASGGSSSFDDTLTIATLRIDPNVADFSFAAAAQNVLVVFSATSFASPMAAPDLQAIIMIAMLPCSNSYQRITMGMFRALSIFTLSDSLDGVLWGNLIANVAGLALCAVFVVIVSIAQKKPLSEAMITARFPSLYFSTLWLFTYGSNMFASVQLLSDPKAASSSKGLAAGVLVVFCIGIPAGLAIYILRCLEGYYSVYEYHNWQRNQTGMRVRLLSTALLPVGRWEPIELRRRLGTIVTMQCRPEFIWIMLPLASPIIISLFSLARGLMDRICIWLYIVMAFLHLLLIAVLVFFRPLRTMLELWLCGAAYFITTMYLTLSAVNLAKPRLDAVAAALTVVGYVQVALVVIRTLYHIAHIFIARRLSTVVPKHVVFEWNRGSAYIEDPEFEAFTEMKDRKGDHLQSQLEQLLNEQDSGDLDSAWVDGDEQTENLLTRPLPSHSEVSHVDDAVGEDDAILNSYLSGLKRI